MARFWIVVFPMVRAELHGWKRTASAIPDPELRAQALATLHGERLSAAGAALFAATSTRPPAPGLVRALVAYQVICDYLDTLAEQPSADPVANGARLHRALVDAVADGPRADYYGLHRVQDDGGYLAALVDACRREAERLPAFAQVGRAAEREAGRNVVQGMNHAPAGVRETALQEWARGCADPAAGDAAWFELAAAGSSSLAVLALLAAAADPTTTVDDAERVRRAYFPWIEALSTLLDSVADREHDRRTGELNFADQYPSPEAAVARLHDITARAVEGARGLPNGERHVVLVAGMIALHVSEEGAWLPESAPAARAVLHATDTAIMPPLLLLLRTWRRARARRARCRAAAAPSAPTPSPA